MVFRPASGASSSFKPSDLPGLQLWLDASSDSFVADSSNRVSAWKDLSGNNRENLYWETTNPGGGTGWYNGYETLTTAQNDVFGGTTATKLVATADNQRHSIVNIVGSRPTYGAGYVAVFSCYIKNVDAAAGVYGWIGCETTWNGSVINLSTGAIVNSNGVTATSTSVGNGWYFISISYTLAGSVSLKIHMGHSDSATASDGPRAFAPGATTTGYLVCYPSLRASHTDPVYVPTTSAAVVSRSATQATDANKPVVTRGDNGENLGPYSEALLGTGWSRRGLTVTDNFAAGPIAATVNASKCLLAATTDYHDVYDATPVNAVSGISYTISAYLQYGGSGTEPVMLRMAGTPLATYQLFNLHDGTLGASSGTPVNPFMTSLGNGWYYCGFSKVAGSSGAVGRQVAFRNVSGTFAGDGTSYFLIAGLSFRTTVSSSTYIPTTTLPAYSGLNGVRSLLFDGVDDRLILATTDAFSSNDRTFICSVLLNADTATFETVWGGPDAELIFGLKYQVGPGIVPFLSYNNSVPAQEVIYGTTTALTYTLRTVAVIGFRQSVSGASVTTTLYLNGRAETTTKATGRITVTSRAFNIGAYSAAGSLWLNGKLGELIAYNRALTDSEIAKLSAYAMKKWRV